jgi:hypothetical protein
MKKVVAILAGAALLMIAGSAFALPLNSNRPLNNGNLGSLQTILNDNFNNSIDAVKGQSSAALWQESDGTPTAYAVAAVRGDTGVLGIYNPSGQEYILLTNPQTDSKSSFAIDAAGTLSVNNVDVLYNFGPTFGFFWRDTTTPSTAYTEDSKNTGIGTGPDGNIRALSYLVKDGTTLTGNLAHYFSASGQVAKGNDDWALAFEDLSPSSGSDFDFNDAVFYVKDISAVPEPGTILLLGAGLVGLGFYGRRRMKA